MASNATVDVPKSALTFWTSKYMVEWVSVLAEGVEMRMRGFELIQKQTPLELDFYIILII
jgi:hypothetical protein